MLEEDVIAKYNMLAAHLPLSILLFSLLPR